MNAPELKPCLCGGKPSTNDGGNSTYGRFWWCVWCDTCQFELRDLEVWDKARPGMLDPAYPPGECLTRWNRRADLPAPVKVKDLVWDGFKSGSYKIEVEAGGIANLWFCGKAIDDDDEHELLRGGYLTLVSIDDLKAAAQADYTARILAALEASPPMSDPRVAALVEAVTRYAFGYMQDEAAEPDLCVPGQHEAAKAVFAALEAAKGAGE